MFQVILGENFQRTWPFQKLTNKQCIMMSSIRMLLELHGFRQSKVNGNIEFLEKFEQIQGQFCDIT